MGAGMKHSEKQWALVWDDTGEYEFNREDCCHEKPITLFTTRREAVDYRRKHYPRGARCKPERVVVSF